MAESNIKEIEQYLNKRIKVEISDGRVITGSFWCVDKGKNLVMAECEEFRKTLIKTKDYPDGTMKETTRAVGLVILPGKHILKIFGEQETNNANT